jgi:hypothetical protein
MTRQERAYRQGAITEQERDAALLVAENRDQQAKLDAELSDHPLAGEAESDR